MTTWQLRVEPRPGPASTLRPAWTNSFAAHFGPEFKFYFDTLEAPQQLGLLSPCCSTIFLSDNTIGVTGLPRCFSCQTPMAQFYPEGTPVYVRSEGVAEQLAEWLSHTLGPLRSTLAAAQLTDAVEKIRSAARLAQANGNPLVTDAEGKRFMAHNAHLFTASVAVSHG